MSRLLVIELHHLGDAVLALPFLRSALEAGHEVSVLCRPPAADIFSWVLPRDKIITWEPPWHEETPGRGFFAGLAECHRMAEEELVPGAFDIAVSVWADPRVHWLMRQSGIPERFGYAANSVNFYAADFNPRRRSLRAGQVMQALCQLPPWKPLLTCKLKKSSPHQHHFASWQQIAEALSLPVPRLPMQPLPEIAKSSKSYQELLRRPTLAIAPSARLSSKRWPMRHFATVADQFLAGRPEWQALWVLPPGEQDVSVSDGSLVVCPETLDDLCSAIAGASLLLCNDSLPAHVASMLATPVISVFRTGNPAWFAPVGTSARAAWEPLNLSIPIADADGGPSYVALEGPSPAHVLELMNFIRQLDD